MTEIIEIGNQIGSYTLLGLLGVGGMGTVYRALDSERGCDIALKIAFTEAGRKDRSATLIREFETLRRLDHPAIPKVFCSGKTDVGTAFFSMELAEGEALADVIKRSALPPVNLRINWLRDIADALAHVHARGFLYCDLKPENIIITPGAPDGRGSVRLLDFGIAIPIAADSLLPAIAARGTTEYMSPEQHRHLKLDARSDIYSFGVLAFELLTGERPFKIQEASANEAAKSLKYSAMHTKGKVRSPRTLNPDVPKDLSAIVETCLEKRRSNRFQSAQELRNCLSTADGSSLLTHLFLELRTKLFG